MIIYLLIKIKQINNLLRNPILASLYIALKIWICDCFLGSSSWKLDHETPITLSSAWADIPETKAMQAAAVKTHVNFFIWTPPLYRFRCTVSIVSPTADRVYNPTFFDAHLTSNTFLDSQEKYCQGPLSGSSYRRIKVARALNAHARNSVHKTA